MNEWTDLDRQKGRSGQTDSAMDGDRQTGDHKQTDSQMDGCISYIDEQMDGWKIAT